MRIALVSYINTTPFTDGLRHEFSDQEVNLNLLPPSDCAKAFQQGDVDIALLPVGSLPDLDQVSILPNWCIGANGSVESVFIVSQRPIEELDTIYLDPHSRSSNGLANILMQYHWHINPALKNNPKRSFTKVKDRTGAVIIGDQAIRMRGKFRYVYDLSKSWQQLTGMPFTFAVWAYKPGAISAEQIERLNKAFAYGVEHALESAERWASHFQLNEEFCKNYLSQYIEYNFDAGKHRAMQTYLGALQQIETTAEFYSLYLPAASKVA
ncbi:MAG: menaquinone biosynthetic enzyme MqnA/MqnD family protein [Bacteroidia bacterium]